MKTRMFLCTLLMGLLLPCLGFAQNRPAVDGSFGYVLLDPNSDIAAQMTAEKTVYEVQQTIDLQKQTIQVPSKSILKFSGGLIKNGTLNFDYTYLEGLVQFQNCSFQGELWNESVTLSWFGASVEKSDNSKVINEVLNICRAEVVVDGLYPINQTLMIRRHVVLRGLYWSESVYANNVGNARYGFKTSSRITAIRLAEHGGISMLGITVLGDESLYINRNLHDNDGVGGKPLETCGILMKTDAGYIDAIFDCSFVGFTYGIRAEGRYIEKIKGTYFSACRFGLFTAWTSDYICEDCHFNTNMLNYELKSHAITDNMPNKIRKIGAGAVVKGAGMARFLNCKFEYNFIHIILDEGCTIFNLEDCIFDAATHSSIFIYNENASNNWLTTEIFKPSMNCINISGNTFCRGSRCERWQQSALAGSAIMYVRESNDRGMNINFVNNVVVDKLELNQDNVSYEETIFRIYCNDECGIINSAANDFSHCEAKTVAAVVNGSKGRFVIKDNGSNFGNISHQFESNSVIDIRHTELDDDGRIVIWKTLTDGNSKSADIILDPTK